MPIRNPISETARREAKDLILDIIAAAGGELFGKTKLNKIAYFATLQQFSVTGVALTSYPFVRLPQGPALEQCTELLAELALEGELSLQTRPAGPFTEEGFRLLDEGRTVDPSRIESIQWAVDNLRDRTAAQVSELSHEMSRSWQETPTSYEMAWMRDILPDADVVAVRRTLGDVSEIRGRLAASEFDTVD